ncbi:MAG: alanine racemase [Candidatus Cloacimonetes bacterium]|nr:alanine racemase [Candidatus Cloacimonadota bacterium]
MISRVNLHIDLKKIQENYLEIVKSCPGCLVMPILKANAYGLGAQKVARSLGHVGASIFGVADLNEAKQISSIVEQVLLLGSMLPQELDQLVIGVSPSISSFEEAVRYSNFAKSRQLTLKVHILIDTGMGRLGLLIDQAYSEITKIIKLPNIEVEGIFSHFSSANYDRDFSLYQISQMKVLITKLSQAGLFFSYCHIANSDGINNIQESLKQPFNMVRSGINLFGVFDSQGEHRLNLQSVLKLKSKLVAKRFLKKGSPIGYSQSHILSKDTWVGTVPIGYADGVPQNLSEKAFFYYKDQAYQIIGKVSMDYTMIDLGANCDLSLGQDIDILRGTQDIVNWAKIKGTIPYDIICSIGNRVKRVYES